MASPAAIAQIKQILASLPQEHSDQVTVSPIEARTFDNYCKALLIANQVFHLEESSRSTYLYTFDGVKIIDETENLDLLAFCVFAAIESKNTAVLSYIKTQRPHTFIPALKIAIERARITNREMFFDALFSPLFKTHLTPDVLADLLLSPHNPNLSLLVLAQMPMGFFKDEHILAAVRSAVDSADYSPLAGVYLTELLKSAHNICNQPDYVEIFIDSCVKNSPDNRGGLKALLRYLSNQSVIDVFSSVAKMPTEIAGKVLPIIFKVRGDTMDTEAVIQQINHGNGNVLTAAYCDPTFWSRISHLVSNSVAFG